MTMFARRHARRTSPSNPTLCEHLEQRVVLTGGFGVDLSYVGGNFDFGSSFYDYDSGTGSLNFSNRLGTGGFGSLDFTGFDFGGSGNKNSLAATYSGSATATFDNQVGAGFDAGGLGYIYEWNNAGTDFRLSLFMDQAVGLVAGDRDGSYTSSGMLFNDTTSTPTMHGFTSDININGNDVTGAINGDFGSIDALYTIASLFGDGFTALNNDARLLFGGLALQAFGAELDIADGFRSISYGFREGTGFVTEDFEGKTISGVMYSSIASRFDQGVADSSSTLPVTIRLRQGGQAEIFDSEAFYDAIGSSTDPGQGELGTYTYESGRLTVVAADGMEIVLAVNGDMTAFTPTDVFDGPTDIVGDKVFGAFSTVMTGETLPPITPPSFPLTMVTQSLVSYDEATDSTRLALFGADGETPIQNDLSVTFTTKPVSWASSDGSGYWVAGQTAGGFVMCQFGLGFDPIQMINATDDTGGTNFNAHGFTQSWLGERASFTGFDTAGDPISYTWSPIETDTSFSGEVSYENIGDDLRSNSEAIPTPDAGSHTHETSWGTKILTFTVDGKTTTVWAPEGLRYFVTDIQEEAGNDTRDLTGDIKTVSADYGTITITGLDTTGRLASYWWHVTNRDWRYASIGQDAGAPQAAADSISSYFDARDNSINHYYVDDDIETGYNLRWKPTNDIWINYDLSEAYPSGFTELVPMFMVAENYVGTPQLFGWVGTGLDDQILWGDLDDGDEFGIDDNGTPNDPSDDLGLLAIEIRRTF